MVQHPNRARFAFFCNSLCRAEDNTTEASNDVHSLYRLASFRLDDTCKVHMPNQTKKIEGKCVRFITYY